MIGVLDKLGLVYFWGKIKTWTGNNYVAKENGKGLSTNDYTTAEKNKLNGIATGADVNVQANWAETDSADDAFIKNKPTIPSKTSDLTNDSGFITTSDIPEGAAASASTPLMDGTAAVGTETKWAKGDHVHPTDTSRAADDSVVHISGNENISGNKKILTNGKIILQNGFSQIYNEDDGEYLGTVLNSKAPKASPALTGTPTAPTASAGTNTTQIATTAFVSTAVGAVTTTSLGAIPTTQKGAANGVCPLNSSSKIDSTYLPSYVDDVIEAYARSGQTPLSQNWLATGSASGTVISPESGKIYVLMNDVTSGNDVLYSANSQFRWATNTYTKLNDGGITAITNAEIDQITAN